MVVCTPGGELAIFTALQFGVSRQRGEPRLRRIAGQFGRRARIGKQKPSPLFAMAEDLRDAIRPASKKLRR